MGKRGTARHGLAHRDVAAVLSCGSPGEGMRGGGRGALNDGTETTETTERDMEEPTQTISEKESMNNHISREGGTFDQSKKGKPTPSCNILTAPRLNFLMALQLPSFSSLSRKRRLSAAPDFLISLLKRSSAA